MNIMTRALVATVLNRLQVSRRFTAQRGSRFLSLASVLLLSSSFAAGICINDVGGANDPSGDGQKDLTRICLDISNLPSSYITQLSWDDLGIAGGNTADACFLFDTDADSLINFAICNSLGNNPFQIEPGFPQAYSCTNTAADRCTGSAPLSLSAGTTCVLTQESTDPFPSGDDYPLDTTVTCTIDTADIPGTNIQVNACSYPSAVPNSAPSDCVVELTVTDLAVQKTDGLTEYPYPPSSVDYTITVTNTGADFFAATVFDLLPAGTTGSWTCVADPGSSCGGSGSGNLLDLIDIEDGDTITYTVTVNVPGGFTGDLVNTATVAGGVDTDPSNNSAT
ncbi:MAG: DUF11 domain-containing protein, partial [Acidobacteria bacterium]